MNTVTIIGSFSGEGECARAVRAVRTARIDDFHTFSPFPSHKIAAAIELPKSPSRWVALVGGIAGILTGLAVTIGTTYEWRLNAGGKPLVSWPPFIVITFELMILLGGISGFLAFLFMSGVPAFESASGYNSHFGEDRFGLVVRCTKEDADGVESMLKTAGAEEVVRGV